MIKIHHILWIHRVLCQSSIMICFVLFATCNSSDLYAKEWTFTSMVGQHIGISIDDDYVSIKINDVNIRYKLCKMQEYRICFETKLLDLAIPNRTLSNSETWGVGRSKYKLISYIDKLYLLGKTCKNVAVIEAESLISNNTDSTESIRNTIIMYSFSSNGLIGFQDKSMRDTIFFNTDDICSENEN